MSKYNLFTQQCIHISKVVNLCDMNQDGVLEEDEMQRVLTVPTTLTPNPSPSRKHPPASPLLAQARNDTAARVRSKPGDGRMRPTIMI